MSTYKAWVQNEVGPFTDLKIESMEMPGMYQSNPATPFVPGFEVAGIVKECSENSELKVGDRVVGATTVFRSGRYGSFGEYCISSEKLTYKIPDEISFEAAAGILMAYLTSDFALHRRGEIKAGQRVLVNAAAGGVGGNGGGGAGGRSTSPAAVAGTANTGGGGGGGASNSACAANGGSGLVVIRYKFK